VSAERLIWLATAPMAWRGLVVLGLAIGAAASLLPADTLPEPRPLPAPAVRANPEASPVAPLPARDYAAIVEHPLFDPTRTPYVAPKVPEPPAKPALSPLREYILLGIVIGNGARIAVLKPPANGKPVIAAEGQAVGGWTLRRITPNGLRFESGEAGYDMRFPGPPWLNR
jgi:hypothetical protein